MINSMAYGRRSKSGLHMNRSWVRHSDFQGERAIRTNTIKHGPHQTNINLMRGTLPEIFTLLSPAHLSRELAFSCGQKYRQHDARWPSPAYSETVVWLPGSWLVDANAKF